MSIEMTCDDAEIRPARGNDGRQRLNVYLTGVREEDLLNQMDTERVVAWLQANTDYRIDRRAGAGVE